MALDSEHPTVEFSFLQFFLLLVCLFAISASFFYLKLQWALSEASRTCDLPLEDNLKKLLEDQLNCGHGD